MNEWMNDQSNKDHKESDPGPALVRNTYISG